MMRAWRSARLLVLTLSLIACAAPQREVIREVVVVVTATPNQAQETAIPSPQPSATPTAPSPATNTVLPSSTPSCTLDAVFVADITIPDGAAIPAGTEFVKTWRLRNAGTCAWPQGTQLVHVSGPQLASTANTPAPSVNPGGEVEISVVMRAPQAPGSYRSFWQLRTPDGLYFGRHFWVLIAVPEPTAAPLASTQPPTPASPATATQAPIPTPTSALPAPTATPTSTPSGTLFNPRDPRLRTPPRVPPGLLPPTATPTPTPRPFATPPFPRLPRLPGGRP